jgi:hypothetical protein
LLLAAFRWTKSLSCNDAFYQGFFLFSESSFQSFVSTRFYPNSKSEKSDPLHPSEQRDILLTLNCPSIINPDDRNFPSGPSSMSRIFDLFQLASVCTSQQHVRTISVRTLSFIRQVVHIKFNCPDVVYMVWTLKLHIWKLRASIQLSR